MARGPEPVVPHFQLGWRYLRSARETVPSPIDHNRNIKHKIVVQEQWLPYWFHWLFYLEIQLCDSKAHVEIRSPKYLSSKALIPQDFGAICICSRLLCLCLSKVLQTNLSSPVGKGPRNLPESSELLPLILTRSLSSPSAYPKSQLNLRYSSSVSHTWKHPPAHNTSSLASRTWEYL